MGEKKSKFFWQFQRIKYKSLFSIEGYSIEGDYRITS